MHMNMQRNAVPSKWKPGSSKQKLLSFCSAEREGESPGQTESSEWGENRRAGSRVLQQECFQVLMSLHAPPCLLYGYTARGYAESVGFPVSTEDAGTHRGAF